jgi:hypothetical protein
MSRIMQSASEVIQNGSMLPPDAVETVVVQPQGDQTDSHPVPDAAAKSAPVGSGLIPGKGAPAPQAPRHQKPGYKWLGVALMILAIGFAAGASFASLAPRAGVSVHGHDPSLSSESDASLGSNRARNDGGAVEGNQTVSHESIESHDMRASAPYWLQEIRHFLHTFGIVLYAISAPIDLVVQLYYYHSRRRRVPRICICLGIATVGTVLALLGWLLAHWIITLGLATVSAAHTVSVVAELTRWRRRL